MVSNITNYIITEYELNHMFSRSIVLRNKQLLKTKQDVDTLIQKLKIEKPKPFVKWVGGKRKLLVRFEEVVVV